MPKVLEVFENATLVSVEKISDVLIQDWIWRKSFVGRKGTLHLCESLVRHPSKKFAVITAKKDFKFTTSCGKVELTESYLKITTDNSVYVFEFRE